jgi:thioredoxin-related protein
LPSTIEQVHRDLNARGLSVVAVNIQESPETVSAWVAAKGITSRVALDDGDVARRYRVAVTPTVVLVDRQGRMVGKALGVKPWASGQGRELLLALLSGPAK